MQLETENSHLFSKIIMILLQNSNSLERMKKFGDMIKERYDKIDAEESDQVC